MIKNGISMRKRGCAPFQVDFWVVLMEFFVGDGIGGFVEMAGQFGDGVKAGILSPFREAVGLHVFGHNMTPFVKG